MIFVALAVVDRNCKIFCLPRDFSLQCSSVGIRHCPIPNNGLLDFGPNGDIQSNSNSNGLNPYNFGQIKQFIYYNNSGQIIMLAQINIYITIFCK
jgi:hypothetical protein